MPSKAQMYAEIAAETAGRISGSYQRWTDFLETAARLYKYPFHEQLMIYAQRPEATACASFEMWNETMRRYVKRGSKGIALIDPETEKLRYVFDMSDTGARENSRRLYLWEYNDAEHFEAVSKALEQKYDVGGRNGIAEQLEIVAAQLADEFWNEHRRDILSSVDDSFLEDYDDFNINAAFHNAATVSTTYMLLSRCGLDPKEYFTPEDYLSVFDFNTPEAVCALGSAISETSEKILRTVEAAVKNYERERRAERIEHHEHNVRPERRLPDSRPDDRTAAVPRQVRENEEELSQNPQTGSVEQNAPDRELADASSGNRSLGEQPLEPNAPEDDGRIGGDGAAESRESLEVDGDDEQPEISGGGNDTPRVDLHLEPPIGEQLSLFPTEEEQIQAIDSAEEEIASAFSFSEDEINDVLIHGSNAQTPRLAVIAEFEKQKSLSEITDFLSREYRGAAGFKSEKGDFSVRYDSDGIHLSRGRSVTKNAQTISWENAAERIGTLLREGRFASNVELAEAKHNELKNTAESLWYMVRDVDDEYKDTYFKVLREGKTYNFPDSVAQIISDFENPDYVRTVLSELQMFRHDYAENRDILRFHFYRPDRIEKALSDLLLPRIEFQSDMAEVEPYRGFITDDEINEAIRRPHVEDGDYRTYEYFKADHTTKEKADFLKNEYGTGGSVPGWSAWHSSIDYGSKGISFKKDGCSEIQLPWTHVVKYVDKLIAKDEYLTPDRKAEYERRQRNAPSLPDDYAELRSAHPDDIILYQVGDFFEIYGEDAQKAADILELTLTSKAVENERIPMCGIPAFKLEENVEKLRETFGVTVSAVDNSGIRSSYTLRKTEFEREQTPENTSFEPVREAPAQEDSAQSNIDNALRAWNKSPESKRAVVRYMQAHERERDTAAWLANEFGAESGKSFVVSEDVTLPWTKVQRRLAQLIRADDFLTESERAKPEQIETPSTESEISATPYKVGDTVYLEDTAFEIAEIREYDVQLRDPTLLYPVFRAESKERFEQLLRLDERNSHLFESISETGNTKRQSVGYTSETVAVYPGEKNNTPFDVVIEQLRFDEPQRPEPTAAVEAPTIPAQNYRILDDHLGEGGAKAKFRMNMDAINLLKELEFDNRQATPEEQEVLAKYVGWGGLADAFDETKENWANEFQELYAALSPEEYSAARASTLNAHYTSPTVIKAIYEAVGNMGFETGNILEPSMGVGNFFGLLPENMQSSKLYGVELDSITGRIAKQLYPKADITVAGFETTDRRDFYDLAVGNVPFGNYKVNDRAYNKLGFSIHDYFFAKTLDQVRPGGVIAFVTSRYTMDKQSPEVRKYIAERAELLGAIRLPNNAFKANAGTDVVSDILFLQKRDRPITIDEDWIYLDKTDDGFTLNSYFVDHPEMVLGTLSTESTQYGKEDLTVNPIEGASLSEQLHEAIRHIGGNYKEAELPDLGDEKVAETIPADPNVKNYSYAVVDGDVYYRENSVMVKPELNATALERIKGIVAIRQCVSELMDIEMDEFATDFEISRKQLELNRLYDGFTKKYGLINDRSNRLAFSDDSSYYLLCSLEILKENGELDRKADMFTKRTIKQHRSIESVDTAVEALGVSIGERARVDLEFMSNLCQKSEAEIISDLRGVIFKDPVTEKWQTADEYLSGNVRQKLRQAKEAAEENPEYAVNVSALEKAQPKDLDASEIEVRLGATWIDKKYIQQFMAETFKLPYYARYQMQVNYSPYTAEWNISNKSYMGRDDVVSRTIFGTDRASAYQLLEDALNLRDTRIYDTVTDPDGKEKRVLNDKETTLAQQKQQSIKDAFKDWIFNDPRRRETLVKQYNEEMNSIRPREYDGSHIVFSGMTPEISLREHQKNAIAHVLYGGNTLLAHEVGAGKTFEMVAAAMESKRLGMCSKSMFVVPNHLTEQWASEFLRLYPSAKILVTTKKDFETKNRKKFCARIATGDYDAVIMGFSQFEKIPISRERQEALLNEQINDITEGLRELKESNAERFSIKQLEKTKKSLEARLEKLQAEDKKDDVVTFEQLGVDKLFVDEADNYKNLFLYTKMRNVAGLSTTDAQKSSDMFMKCRYLDELTGSRGTVFATGTPVSNSMTEVYTMQRYLQYDLLQKMNMSHFDCWASRFGETTTALELAPEGTGYRARTRFSKFFNLPELMNLFKEAADIKTADQLHLPTPEVEYHTYASKPTETQKEMVKELSERAAKVHSGAVDSSVDNMLKITSDGRKLGLDQRIINPLLPDEEGTKVNQCVRNVLDFWKEGEPQKLTQLIFCDISTPQTKSSQSGIAAKSTEAHALESLIPDDKPKSSFTVYEDIKNKLIAGGMPKEQIAFIHDADTEAKKKELFGKMRSGAVRVLIGSTAKMGAGTNCQDRLIALHDLDCPWRPRDLIQRKGRIERQGNMNEKVHVCRYVTEGTFDAYLWQTVEKKQKFISQIMTSKSPVRSCEDVDDVALSFAEIKALCAGDPRIKERMDLDVEVSKLKLMKADHKSKQFRLEDNLLKHYPAEIEKTEKFISGFKADIQTLAEYPLPKEGFIGIEIRGDKLTDRENAGAALMDAIKDFKETEPLNIGHYRGLEMSLARDGFDLVLTLKGQMTHHVALGEDGRGNLIRIENALEKIPDRLKSAEIHLEELKNQQKTAEAEVGKPFPYEAELAEKTARLIELDNQLNLDGSKGQPTQSVNNDIAAKEKPSIIQRLKQPAVSEKSAGKVKNIEMEER